ncbi:MAG: UbiA family prenyltransferase [Bryobacteraceae bacterium]|nr:UbiA family prenyltransferase [Bryobacteraceae bacterium]
MSTPSAVFRAMRPHQWAKNLLIFVPILLAHRTGDWGAWRAASSLFAALSLCASATYVFNDLLDREADRANPAKRHRPFASGALGTAAGAALIAVLMALSVGLIALTDARALDWISAYVVFSCSYSLALKKVPIVDVVLLALLYCFRVFAGGSVAAIPISPWTLAFSLFIFSSLAFLKRYSELKAAPDGAAPGRRGYQPDDIHVVFAVGIGCGIVAVLVVALYIHSPEMAQYYSKPMALWFLLPVILAWVSRMWLAAGRGRMSQDPVLFALRDRWSLLAGAACLAIARAAA